MSSLPPAATRPLLVLPPAPPLTPIAPDGDGASLTGRAVVGVGLLAGIYVLAVAVVVVGVALNVALLRGADRIAPGLIVATVAVAIGLVRSLFFIERRTTDVADGVEVDARTQPQLAALVGEVAAAMGTPPPDRLFLTGEVNAYVFQTGHLLGLLPGKRVLAVGVPLLGVLDVAQLRGVIAHELGHYTGGDTRLGGIIYRGSASIGRIVERQGGGFVGGLFATYGRYYLRVTSGIRRRQEVAADVAAARVAGPGTMADALRAVHAAGAAHGAYVVGYVTPALRAGRALGAPVAGFWRFLAEPVRAAAATAAATDLGAHAGDLYDSHPTLGERLARLAALPPSAPVWGAPPGVTLLADPDRVDAAVGDTWLRAAAGAALPVVGWADLGPTVLGPAREAEAVVVLEAARRIEPAAHDVGTHEVIDSVARRPRELVVALVALGVPRPADDAAEQALLRRATGVAVAVAGITRLGWAWRTSWATGVEVLDSSGHPVPVERWTDMAAEGAAGLDLLHRSLEEWGLVRDTPAVPADGTPVATPSPPVAPSSPSAPALPAPPSVPGVEPAAPPWLLAGTFGGRVRTVRLAVARDRIAFGDDVVGFAEVTSVSFAVQMQAAAIGKSASGTWTIELATATGKAKLKLSVTAAEPRRAFEAVFAWVLDVLERTVLRRLADEAIATVRAGGSVEMAGLRMDATGVTPPGRRGDTVAWRSVAGAGFSAGQVVVAAVGARRPCFSCPTATANAAVVPTVVTELATLLR